jgi:cobyrinic acid a,c-diamide synthase
MYLGESLTVGTRNYPMVGILPVAFAMEKRPQGHGYTILEVERQNPFFQVGSILKGHEFHHSRVLWLKKDRAYLAYRVKRGNGIDGNRDGLCYKNVLATYSHIHALGCEGWAEGLIQRAMERKPVDPAVAV